MKHTHKRTYTGNLQKQASSFRKPYKHLECNSLQAEGGATPSFRHPSAASIPNQHPPDSQGECRVNPTNHESSP